MSDSALKAEGVFRWYVPGSAVEEGGLVAGTLEISAEGVSTLALVGMLSEASTALPSLVLGEFPQMHWIIGVLKDQSYVLLGRLSGGGSTFGRALSHQTFRAQDCLVFHQMTEFPDLGSVTKLQIELDALGDWAAEPVVKVNKTKNGASARGSAPSVRTFKLASKTLRLKTSIRYTAPADAWHRSVTIGQQTHFEVEPMSPGTLESARRDFHLLEDLVLMLSDVDVSFPWPTLRFGATSCIYYFERRVAAPASVDVMRCWSTLQWLGSRLGTVLRNLEEKREVLGPGLYLYLGIRRGKGLYLENQFSTLIFGLESLHRRTGAPAAQTKLDEKIQRILSKIERKKDHDWLKGRLKNAGEPNLEERLFSTFSELDVGLEAASLRLFAKECADLRNQVAHFGGQRDGGYDDFVNRMHRLNEAVRPLYHAVLLHRIGFGQDRIHAYFHRAPYSGQRKKALERAGLVISVRPVG